MTKRKRRENGHMVQVSSPTSLTAAERRRQRAAEYNRRPEVREKQRIRMAERRAAVKAKRRQWDPPTPVKRSAYVVPVSDPHSQTPDLSPTMVNPTKSTLTPVLGGDGPTDGSEVDDSLSLNAAEIFAMCVLADLADQDSVSEDGPLGGDTSIGSVHDNTGPGSPLAVPHKGGSAELSVCATTMAFDKGTSARSSLLPSSELAVHAEPTFKKKGRKAYWTESEPLPPAVSPASRQQKSLWREVGMLGPLTYVQQVQIQVANLACPLSEDSDVSDGDAEEVGAVPGARPWSAKFVTRDVFMDIVRWRKEEGCDGYESALSICRPAGRHKVQDAILKNQHMEKNAQGAGTASLLIRDGMKEIYGSSRTGMFRKGLNSIDSEGPQTGLLDCNLRDVRLEKTHGDHWKTYEMLRKMQEACDRIYGRFGVLGKVGNCEGVNIGTKFGGLNCGKSL
ncbi:hypothetical protein DFH07DRAFT_771348 [Mycena maculata]|uniref:Uncharacterized protein n=1 Tax=Mycena maculata TaxID=230809 RepID=A0AAD7JD35_9AGAR|nr:hypothetical protein DFH07DRAFT_771348 [Mycena maculata]